MATTPAYRRPLNQKQLHILNSLYSFRFVTSSLLASELNLKPSKAYERLKILLDQGYIGRRYDKSYRLQGKSASYHLLPKGIEVLKNQPDNDYQSAVLRRLAKDHEVSDRFVSHWLAMFAIYTSLKARYPALTFFTKTELYQYSSVISPRPDAFIRLDRNGSERQYFLDYLDPEIPRFATLGRVRQYIEYSEDETWPDETGTPLPTIIFVTPDRHKIKRIKAQIKAELEDSYAEDDVTIRVVTPQNIVL